MRIEEKEARGMPSNFPIELVLAVVAGGAIAAGFAWGLKKARGVHARVTTAELEFERSMLGGVAGSQAAPIGAPAKPTAPAFETFPRPIAEPQAASAPAGATVQLVIDRLQAANLLSNAEGPLRSNNPDLAGTVLRLKNGKLIVVLDSDPKIGDPDFDLLFRRFDAVVVPDASEPLMLKRFQSLIAESISF